jgi:hypothetical protein
LMRNESGARVAPPPPTAPRSPRGIRQVREGRIRARA